MNNLIFPIQLEKKEKASFLERFLPYHKVISRENVYLQLLGSPHVNTQLVKEIEEESIRAVLSNGQSVVVDNPNLTKKDRQEYIRIARQYRAKPIAVIPYPENAQHPIYTISIPKAEFEMPIKEEGLEKIIDAYHPRNLYGSTPAIFIDRDGVIFSSVKKGEEGFVNTPEEIRYEEKAIEGLQLLQKTQLPLVMISNQASVGYGHITEGALEEISQKMKEDLRKEGISFKDIYYCTHKEHCVCRKPATGLIIQAAIHHALDPTQSFVIGDMTSDVETGKRVHSTTILMKTGFGGQDNKFDTRPDYTTVNLVEAARIISEKIGR